jgi:transposase InsO family protein
MDVHKNARTTPYSRALIAQRVTAGASLAAVAQAAGICARTARKWAGRAAEGPLALEDRSCRPHHSPRAIGADVMVEIERLRRRYRWTGVEIAAAVRVSKATAARTLRQLGLARLTALEPVAPVLRYEWPRPGQMLHLDIKKLGRIARVGHRITGDRRDRSRGAGWEYVHVCVDDCSRVAYAEVLRDERGVTVAAFLRRAVAWFRRRGVVVQRVLTDNGTGYRSHTFKAAVDRLGVRHRRVRARRTRPYTPRTNGKAERFIKTMLREWAYVMPYATSAQRNRALPGWLHRYNWHRRHDALGGVPPISRVVSRDDLLTLHT